MRMPQHIRMNADYMLANKEKLRKGVEDAMGGNLLETESERLTKKGEVSVLYRKLNYSIYEISELLDISNDEVEGIINSLDEK